jgi:hypothetical protein
MTLDHPHSPSSIRKVRASVARHALWLCLLAGCSLNAHPTSDSSSQRATSDAGVWMPEASPNAGGAHATGGSGGSHAATSLATTAAGGKQSTAEAGKPASGGEGGAAHESKGGSMASADTGGRAAEAECGGGGGRAMPTSGGAGSLATASNGGAGGVRAANSGSGGAPHPAGGTTSSLPQGVRQTFVDAVIGVLMGTGQGDQNTWDQWRRAAGNSGDLSPEFVTPMLNALVLSGTCRTRIEACISVCLTVAQNCKPCTADEQCRTTLARVCGDRAASCQ